MTRVSYRDKGFMCRLGKWGNEVAHRMLLQTLRFWQAALRWHSALHTVLAHLFHQSRATHRQPLSRASDHASTVVERLLDQTLLQTVNVFLKINAVLRQQHRIAHTDHT